MSAPKKFSDELRERATRLAVELRRDPATRSGAIRRVAEQLGMHPETLRNWVRQAEIDGGHRPGTSSGDAERIRQREGEVKELKRANEILRTGGCRTNRRILRRCVAAPRTGEPKYLAGGLQLHLGRSGTVAVDAAFGGRLAS